MIPPPRFNVKEEKEKSYFWTYVVLIIGVSIILFHYFVLPNILPDWLNEVPVAHAEEPIRQNDYYCAHLTDYINGSEFKEFCDTNY